MIFQLLFMFEINIKNIRKASKINPKPKEIAILRKMFFKFLKSKEDVRKPNKKVIKKLKIIWLFPFN